MIFRISPDSSEWNAFTTKTLLCIIMTEMTLKENCLHIAFLNNVQEMQLT